jgi:hypothetical protein
MKTYVFKCDYECVYGFAHTLLILRTIKSDEFLNLVDDYWMRCETTNWS